MCGHFEIESWVCLLHMMALRGATRPRIEGNGSTLLEVGYDDTHESQESGLLCNHCTPASLARDALYFSDLKDILNTTKFKK